MIRAKIQSVRGFTIIEVVLGIGLILVLLTFSAPYFLSVSRASKQTGSKSACQTVANVVANRLVSAGQLEGALPFEQSDLEINAFRNQIAPRAFYKRVDDLEFATNPHLYTPINDALGGVEIDNSKLLKGAIARVANIYNEDLTFCSSAAPGKNITSSIPELLTQAQIERFLPGLGAIEVYARIRPYFLNDQSYETCKTIWPRPRNLIGLDEAFAPAGTGSSDPNRRRIYRFAANTYSDYGFELALTVRHAQPGGGNPEECQTTRKFELPVDRGVVFQVNSGGSLDKAQLERHFVRNFKPRAIEKSIRWGAQTGATARDSGSSGLDSMINRQQCSQSSVNEASFDLDIRIPDYLEPGAIVLCRDLSIQRLQKLNDETAIAANTVAWCHPKAGQGVATNPAPQVNFQHWKTPDSKWVPCDQLKICGVDPTSRMSRQSYNAAKPSFLSDGGSNKGFVLHYETIGNDPRLWGCDVYVDMAIVDMAGNIRTLERMISETYPGNDAYQRKGAAGAYFKPTDCYLCRKKPKRRRFSSFFKIVLIVAAIVLTGGTGWGLLYGFTMTTNTLIGLGAACLIFCDNNSNFDAAGSGWSPNLIRSCKKDVPNHICTKAPAPMQPWDVAEVDDPDQDPAGQCSGTLKAHPTYDPGETFTINNGREIKVAKLFHNQIHNGRYGVYCEKTYRCDNGTFMPPTQPADGLDADHCVGVAMPMRALNPGPHPNAAALRTQYGHLIGGPDSTSMTARPLQPGASLGCLEPISQGASVGMSVGPQYDDEGRICNLQQTTYYQQDAYGVMTALFDYYLKVADPNDELGGKTCYTYDEYTYLEPYNPNVHGQPPMCLDSDP